MTPHPFVSAVAAVRFANTFNPYSDTCPFHDHPEAPVRRSNMLSSLIERAMSEHVDAIWIGRDLGYRGGRRTGLALTDDINLVRHTSRWQVSADRPTVGVAVSERTAAIIWSMLEQISANVFLWNVFPLHPHESSNPLSNRQHTAKERLAGEEILDTLVTLLRPARVVAIGNDARATAERVCQSLPIMFVRHPSYGGQREFLQQVTSLYKLGPTNRLI